MELPSGIKRKKEIMEKIESLSPREIEVLQLIRTGFSNKIMADRLFVTEKTIKFHLTNIFKKLEVVNRVQCASISSEFRAYIDDKCRPRKEAVLLDNIERDIFELKSILLPEDFERRITNFLLRLKNGN